jgi:autotransporter-associated beta strand protein
MNTNEKIELTDLEPNNDIKAGTGLAKVGPGTLTLNNANTYTGQTTANINGNLQIADLTSAAIDPS